MLHRLHRLHGCPRSGTCALYSQWLLKNLLLHLLHWRLSCLQSLHRPAWNHSDIFRPISVLATKKRHRFSWSWQFHKDVGPLIVSSGKHFVRVHPGKQLLYVTGLASPAFRKCKIPPNTVIISHKPSNSLTKGVKDES